MQHNAQSIRPFLGSKNFDVSREFYRELGFVETVISHNMSFFRTETLGFYLQDAFVKDWVDNTMVFLEVDDVERHWKELNALDLPARFPGVRVSAIRVELWGQEYFVHDPCGILWHFGQFCR